MKALCQKTRQFADRTVRCYLTYRCSANCEFCSAQIPEVRENIRPTEIGPDTWAKGLNRRCRHSILAGGEPFLYRHFERLIGLLEADKFKIEIYTNLRQPVDGFLKAARGRYMFLVSLHPGTDRKAWLGNIEKLAAANHGVRIHIVRSAGFEELQQFIRDAGLVERFRSALQGDQRSGIKSSGAETNRAHPRVNCVHRIFLFGPDGNRYHCVHKMMTAEPAAERGHISGADGANWTRFAGCAEFGLCAGCDNNIEGRVEEWSV
jgi:hypothetical protein